MTNSFDFAQALQDLQSGKNLTGKDGILTPLIKQLTEAALNVELAMKSVVKIDEKAGKKCLMPVVNLVLSRKACA